MINRSATESSSAKAGPRSRLSSFGAADRVGKFQHVVELAPSLLRRRHSPPERQLVARSIEKLLECIDTGFALAGFVGADCRLRDAGTLRELLLCQSGAFTRLPEKRRCHASRISRIRYIQAKSFWSR